MQGTRSARLVWGLVGVLVAGSGLACSATPAAPAGPDPAALNPHIVFKPAGREVGRARGADGLVETSFVVGRNPVKDVNPGYTIAKGTFVADLNRHQPRPGFTPYLSFVGTHPDLPGATCHVTAWRKDGAPHELVLPSSTVTYDPATEVGIVITADCQADAPATG